MNTLTESRAELRTEPLIERVDKLIQGHRAPHEWGSPHLAATPRSLALAQLAIEVAELEDAVREIALEVEKLSRER